VLDPLIDAEIKYKQSSGKAPNFIVLGQKQLRMIEDLVNGLIKDKIWTGKEGVKFDENYQNTSKWRGMTIKIDSRKDYIGFY